MTTLPTAIAGASERPSRVRAAVKRLVLPLAALWRARTHRREVADLLRLDDRMLKDIGLVRTDVLGALAEPAGVDPSVGLRLRSVEHQLLQRDREAQVLRRAGRRPERPRAARASGRQAAA